MCHYCHLPVHATDKFVHIISLVVDKLTLFLKHTYNSWVAVQGSLGQLCDFSLMTTITNLPISIPQPGVKPRVCSVDEGKLWKIVQGTERRAL